MARRKPITVDDLWALTRLGAPSLSPDGAQAVVALNRYSMDENSSQSALWLLSTLGGAPRALTQCGDKDGQPRWSPHRKDGSELIAFTAKREQEGKKDSAPQLYVIAPDGGEARRAANVATGVDAFRWCPDGQRLVFISWVWPELKGNKAQAKAAQAFKDRKETGYATSAAQYRHWDHNLPMGRVPHLHLLTLGENSENGEGGKVRDLFEGSPYQLALAEPGAHDFDISPDGKRIVFAYDPAPEKRGDGRYALVEMEIKSGKAVTIACDPEWDLRSPRYSPDGQRVAFTASHQAIKHTMPGQLAVWDRATGTHEVVSGEWDHEVHAPLLWEEDGLALLFCTEDKGRMHLFRFDLADRRAEVVVHGGWVGAFDKVAGTLVTVADSARHPARAHAHLPGAAPLRLEAFNDALMDKLALGHVEEVWIEGGKADATSEKGDPVQMWLVYPPNFDPKKKHAVMHNIHGGPHTGPGDNWHYRWNTQLFAAQGYVVASVNYHGSSGFGYAFLDSITHRWGELELQDVEAGTDWLLAKRWVDKKRIFATGGSYGGYMVAWMNGHIPAGRYQAYVCHAGCFDWVGMFADDAWHWHAKELGAWYWDDMAQLGKQSPHAFAATMATPTLVIHGALDYRVPDAQGLAYYNTLKAKGVDSRLLWFPDENHWILKPRNSQLWYAEFFGWLKRHDKHEKPAKATKSTQ
jgi:dipeptidyl aminopeptidase/acylaminoacyl peptidase